MDYEKMWKGMKSTYEQRVEKLEAEGKKGTKTWEIARRFVDVMTYIEIDTESKIKFSSTNNGIPESDGMDAYHFRRFKEGK